MREAVEAGRTPAMFVVKTQAGFPCHLERSEKSPNYLSDAAKCRSSVMCLLKVKK